MDDRIHTTHHDANGLGVGKISQYDFLVWTGIAKADPIGQPQDIAVGFEPLPQSHAQAARGAG
jgi:hypothetical protein